MKDEQRIYYKMEDWEQRLYEKVSNQLMTNFGSLGDFITIESMWCMIDELSFTLEQLEEEYENIKKEIEY